MNAVLDILGIVATLGFIAALITAMVKGRGTANSAKIAKSIRYYRLAVVGAAIATILELFDLHWWSLVDFFSLAMTIASLWFANARLKSVMETERLVAERTARENDLPWVADFNLN